MNAYQYFTWAGNPGDNCDLCHRTIRKGYYEIDPYNLNYGKILCTECGLMRKEVSHVV
jgi:hypothetical protein